MPSSYPDSHLQHLEHAMRDALERTPFYARWKGKDPGASAPLLERLRALPTLSRREMRAGFPRLFTPEGQDFKAALDGGEIEIVATSGTTDDRVQVLWWQPWWDSQEKNSYLSGHPLAREIWSRDFREVVLTTPVCSAGVCHMGDLPMKERIHERMLFLNQKADPVHWSAKDFTRMASELTEYAPEAIEADPAYLAALARYAVQKGLKLQQPRYIGLTYEFISRTYLSAIRAAFPGVPILDSYGSTEAGCLHLSCEHGRLHPNLGWTHTDIVPFKPEHGGPTFGRIVATVLQNKWLKLLRYETSDLARFAPEPCPCGRPGEALMKIEGRLKDITFKAGGQVVSPEMLDVAIGDVPALEGYQVTQEAKDKFLVRYVPAAEQDVAVQRELTERLRALYGGELTLLRETSINPELSGKYRLAKCEFEFDPMALFA